MTVSRRAFVVLTAATVLGICMGWYLPFNTESWTTHCPERPLERVHDPERLEVRHGCVFVAGTVVDVPPRHPLGDRDHRYLLQLDPSYSAYGDARDGRLWLEVVPGHEFQVRARPVAGDVVEAVGTHVYDRDHGWLEIHPVTWLRVVR